MTPNEYAQNWKAHGGIINPIHRDKLNTFGLKPETIDFLSEGLPDSAAPFLGFYGDTDDGLNIERLEDYCDFEVEAGKYIVIGSDGEGNPLAINYQKKDLIELLDHEDDFQPTYCNASLRHLVTFLIIYRDFIEEVRSLMPDAFFYEHFTDEQYQSLKQKLTMVDAAAVNNDGLWKWELQSLIANREYYRNNPD